MLFCSHAGEKGKVLPSHITDCCFSKMLQAVLKGGGWSCVPNIWGFTATWTAQDQAVIAGCGKYFTCQWNTTTIHSAVYNILSAILVIFNGSLLFYLLKNEEIYSIKSEIRKGWCLASINLSKDDGVTCRSKDVQVKTSYIGQKVN